MYTVLHDSDRSAVNCQLFPLLQQQSGMPNLAYKLGQIGPKISFSIFWLAEQKCTETDLKKSKFVPFGGQSDPIWMPNLTYLCNNGVSQSWMSDLSSEWVILASNRIYLGLFQNIFQYILYIMKIPQQLMLIYNPDVYQNNNNNNIALDMTKTVGSIKRQHA